MNAREQCRLISASISADGSLDWEKLDEATLLPDDRILLARLRQLAESTATTGQTDATTDYEKVIPSEADSLPVLSAGEILAQRYRIESFIDRGGMGEVYAATDQLLSVPLALKVIRSEVASDQRALRRFKQEVLLARSISHPNVCRIFDLGWDESRSIAYLTMEFLPGITLTGSIYDGPLPITKAFPMARQLAEGLEAAHQAGVLHRDFKSANVMVVPDPGGDRAVIMDFGLAIDMSLHPESMEEGPGSTKPKEERRLVGTPAYMSPEQVTQESLTPASDFYALGVVLFEITTGALPFERMSVLETALAHVNDAPPSPEKLANLSPSWSHTILRLLSKDPSDRYTTARDLTRALEGHSDDDPPERHSLPAERDVFIGRSAELRVLANQLEGSESRTTHLLTLLGPGGTGKTRLALKYAWESLGRWSGGVWFCDLSEARSVDGIAVALATAMNISLGREDPIIQLGHAIAARRRSLFVLDNFEQVVEHADSTLGHWLKRAADARFLVTSRERLLLPEEFTHELDALDPATHGLDLFTVRAQSHHPGFEIDESNRSLAEEIVVKLDGLPLAIELAASRLRMLSLVQLKARLDDRFQILAGGQPGRQATLRATLDWSWDLLNPWERTAISQLSVFDGGFTLEAAEATVKLSDSDQDRFLLDVLQTLGDKSWIRTSASFGAPRFDMYTTIQDYASEKLESSTRTETEARHGRFYASMGGEDVIEIVSDGNSPARAILETELQNLHIACVRATERNESQVAVATSAAAWEVLKLRAPTRVSVELAQGVLGISPMSPTDRARALQLSAVTLSFAGRTAEACANFEEALTIHRESGDRRNEGLTAGKLGSLLRELGQMDEAEERLLSALELHREVGNHHGEGVDRSNLGIVYAVQGRANDAQREFKSALGHLRQAGDRMGEAILLGNLGNLLNEQRRIEESNRSHEQSLEIFRAIGDRRFEGNVLGNLGALLVDQGQFRSARQRLEAALTIHRDIGNRRFEGNVIFNLGGLLRIQGEFETARSHLEDSLEIFREVGDRRFEGIALAGLGGLYSDLGQDSDALSYFEEALELHREVRDRWFEGITLSSMGTLSGNSGQFEAAKAKLENALSVHREVGDKNSEGVSLGSLTTIYLAQGQLEDARTASKDSLSILRETGDTFELGKVLCLCGECGLRAADRVEAQKSLAEATAIAAKLELTAASFLARALERLRSKLDAGTS